MENQDQITEPKSVLQLLQETSLMSGRVFGKSDEGPQPWLTTVLTDEESTEAINHAKKEKYYREEERLERQRETERINFMKGQWTIQDALIYAQWRARRWCGFSRNNGEDGKPVFKLDDHNASIIHALCYYFLNDPEFENMTIPNADGSSSPMKLKLNKGLLISGGVGVGKTKLMQMFAVNKRQVFEVLKARDLAALFVRKGEQGGYEMIEQFSTVHKPELIKHEDNLWQERIGLCIDDVGTEDEKVSFGNRSNVIAEIIDGRYSNQRLVRCMTHITTNLGINGIKQKYGDRIASRLLEMFNVIELGGNDRRAEQQ